MVQTSVVEWQAYAQSFAFLGNSLLGTVRQTSDIGLSSEFWHNFPTFESSDVAQAVLQSLYSVL